MIFIFYINDIISCIKSSKIALFADDCVLYPTGNNWNNIHDLLQPDLDNISSWFNSNGLRLNVTKTKALIVGSRYKLNNLVNPENFIINGHEIDFVKQYDYLGTRFDAEMALMPLFKNTMKIVSNKVFLLREIY